MFVVAVVAAAAADVIFVVVVVVVVVVVFVFFSYLCEQQDQPFGECSKIAFETVRRHPRNPTAKSSLV